MIGRDMIYLDLALRGGGITLMLLLAALLWRAPIGWEGRMSVLALAVTKSAFLIISTSAPLNLHPTVLANLTLLGSFTPAAVTWLIVTIFLDTPGWRWPWILAGVVMSLAYYAHLIDLTSATICPLMGVVLYAALVGVSLWSTKDDLVECRCRARPGFAAAIAGLALFLTAGQATGVLAEGTMALAIAQGVGILIVALAFAVWLLRPDASLWPGEVTEEPRKEMPHQDDRVDPVLISRIQTAMAADIWREEGLTIGGLARKLAVPEHRLRWAINQGLGYRNFSSFINRARIDAACKILSDPMRSNVTVLEIAYDVGFASVGPFNRAFRTEMGHSPTEYRRIKQAADLADSENSSAMIANLH